ncbi:MAG TPA: exonuclease subunit SbcD, partial [Candidatus Ozemobacteraceae bacterium]|nr:exonuclease subunit SbcD [Candidatus Ozemobacteraceae bacterium]
MRILHTSDLHLGHLLYQRKRDEEHRRFLEWLLEVICRERIDLLLIAGDVFDTGFPSNYALEMYYSFLARCGDAGCRQVVVTGGNHDSPATLQAPGQLLRALRVSVIGAVDRERPEDGLITAESADGTPGAIICAVPYLRDRDVYTPKPAEPADLRAAGIIEGTAAWYRRLVDMAVLRREQLGFPELPIIATGHLFAQGGAKTGSERDLYVGDLGAFPADRFPREATYIALGHLHRPQTARGFDHVRYSGSPLPCSFDEADHAKQVLVCDTSAPA